MSNKINRYHELFVDSIGSKIYINFIGKMRLPNDVHGTIIKVRKTSMKILLDDECIMTVGFRNIRQSIFLSECHRIRYKLYYKCQ